MKCGYEYVSFTHSTIHFKFTSISHNKKANEHAFIQKLIKYFGVRGCRSWRHLLTLINFRRRLLPQLGILYALINEQCSDALEEILSCTDQCLQVETVDVPGADATSIDLESKSESKAKQILHSV